MSVQVLKRKISTARKLFEYSCSQLSRGAANRAIAPIAHVAAKAEGAILCDALWDNPHHWLRLAMFRAAAAEIYGTDLVGVYERSTNVRTIASLRALPLTGAEVVPDLPERYRRTAEAMLKDVRTPSDFMALSFPNDYPVHCLYDSIIKAEQLGQVACDSLATRDHLARALHLLEVYAEILARVRPRAVVLSHPTPARFSTLAWTALCTGLPVFIINYMNRHITIRRLVEPADFLKSPNDLPTLETRAGLSQEQRQRLARKGRDYLGLLVKGEVGQISMLNVYGRGMPHYSSRNEFVLESGADLSKPNVAILGNCWPDFPNGDGQTWYIDYVDWIRTTLAIIRLQPQFNWYLKPHPAEDYYGRRVSLRQLVGNDLPKGVYHWPDRATSTDMMTYVDCVVTASGTSGVEYPAAGRRALVSRKTNYAPWGFTNYARNRDEYGRMLVDAPNLPLPNLQQQEDAAIYIALVHADADPESGRLLLPYGLNSYRLWPTIPSFVEANRAAIGKEIALIRDWLRSDWDCFNVYTVLREAQAQPLSAMQV